MNYEWRLFKIEDVHVSVHEHECKKITSYLKYTYFFFFAQFCFFFFANTLISIMSKSACQGLHASDVVVVNNKQTNDLSHIHTEVGFFLRKQILLGV